MAADQPDFQELLNAARKAKGAGIDPALIRSLGPNAVSGLADAAGGASSAFGAAKDYALQPGGVLKNAAGDYRGAAGGKSSAILGGVGTLLSGDPLGAAISTPVGIGAGAIANRAITAATQPLMGMGTLGKAAGMGIRFAAPALIGGGVQQAVAGMVGGVKTKAGEAAASPGGPDISIGGIPLTEAAREKMQRERDVQAQVYSMNALGNAQRGLDSQALAMGREDTNLRMKAAMPYIEKMNRDNLVNAQAKLASEGAMYQALGRQAGMFKLAQGAQAETGATLRQAISTNPYMNSVMQAPSISFG